MGKRCSALDIKFSCGLKNLINWFNNVMGSSMGFLPPLMPRGLRVIEICVIKVKLFTSNLKWLLFEVAIIFSYIG